MASKIVITIVTLGAASALLIYASFDNKSTSTSPISAPTAVPSKAAHDGSSPTDNQFQLRLDEKRLNPNKPLEPSTSQYPPGHDPFKAFMDAQKQQMEKAGVSPFEK